MALPFYVSPEQLMKDKSDYAQKGIARGKSVIAMEYSEGIMFVAENPSATLHKISEIYDRIAFAGVGKFNEYETLRMHGIRQADVRGYSFSREDVTARGLANSYSQILGNIFTESMKPFEVEILVAAVGDQPENNEMYRILYDGSVADQHGFVAMGGQAESLMSRLKETYVEGLDMQTALRSGVAALDSVEERSVAPEILEVAVLDRGLKRRKFRRLTDPEVGSLLS